jgi:hypothetical protein
LVQVPAVAALLLGCELALVDGAVLGAVVVPPDAGLDADPPDPPVLPVLPEDPTCTAVTWTKSDPNTSTSDGPAELSTRS